MTPNRLIDIATQGSMPRYLVPLHPRRMMHYFVDVLIIGGGLAGLRAAQEVDPALSVLIVTKDRIQESNSNYAQGGIASVWDPEDQFDNHVADTLTAGGSLCDVDVVERVVQEAPERIAELIRWGTQFDQHNGEILLGREGGHSHQRILHALGDATGKEIMRAIIAKTRESTNCEIWESAFTLDLLTSEGKCCGAAIARSGSSQPILVWANQTVLCTGGCGQVYRESTNPRVATGDGHAIAYRAGAIMRDMEFMQFHPTVLYIAGSSRTLITEAIRGEGAYLVDSRGYRFMQDYDARLELAPRDIVSQSIVTQMAKTESPCVYLTMKHLPSDHVRQRFPGIAKVCEGFGLDIATDDIPVRPGAHYMIGGLAIDDEGRTNLPGLWAAGEVTSSGLHGANRLASNSLLEGLVFGASAGSAASREAMQIDRTSRVLPLEELGEVRSQQIDIADIRNSLRSLMGRFVGVKRDHERLEEAVQSILQYTNYVLPQSFSTVEGWELQNQLTVALLMATAALQRKESRGVHYRSDFPKVDDTNWKVHLAFQR
jgi:L-aspartate oxidase